MSEVDPAVTDFERRLDAAIQPIWDERKTGYAWAPVDSLLKGKFSLEAGARTKKASSSGRLANVIVESNDRLESFYLILLAPEVSVDQAVRRLRKDVSRFVNVKTVAIADRASGTWRVRALVQERGARDDAATCQPSLPAVPRILYVEPVAQEDEANLGSTGCWAYELGEGDPVPRTIVLASEGADGRGAAPGDAVVLVSDSDSGMWAVGVGRVNTLRWTAGKRVLVELAPLLRFEEEPVSVSAFLGEG